MYTILWILAVLIGIAGVVALLRRQILWGIILIIVALLVGPGGVSIFHP
ncbi:GPGG-motif small membrane protein [Dactylosporangium sp. CA-139066]